MPEPSEARQRKKRIFLKDYEPPTFSIQSVWLDIVLEADRAQVTSRLSVCRLGDAPDIILDGSPFMTLHSIKLDGKVLSAKAYQRTDHSLTVFNIPDECVIETVVSHEPARNTRLEGLYKSSGTFCTQCEAEGFRHITYFIDRPDVLSLYRVRIEAQERECPVLLSNGNLIESGTLPGGRHYAVWDDPFAKPAYLFALVAGELTRTRGQFITQSGRTVTLDFYTARQHAGECGYALESLKKAMAWDEQRYDLEYDLDIYNVVAVSDFNMGAMENKSLNIFNTKYVLASAKTATDDDFKHIESVIGHEYFHNWTGNRVTCRDWFQLSLKEGLTVYRDQEFSRDLGSRDVKRLQDVRTLRFIQFPEDASPLSHPIRPADYVEINNFYTATVYNKGAEIIRMVATILGEEKFKAGLKLYLSRHDGTAATCEDFITAMAEASGCDLTQFFRWYETKGTPVVKVRRVMGEEGCLSLIFQQSYPTQGEGKVCRPLHIPILLDWIGGRPEVTHVSGGSELECRRDGSFLLHMRDTETRVAYKSIPPGAVPSLLREFSAPVKLETDLSFKEQLCLANNDSDGVNRWQAAQNAAFVEIDNAMRLLKTDAPYEASAEWHDFVSAILVDETTDLALLAELLRLPDETDVGQRYQVLEPDLVHRSTVALWQDTAIKQYTAILARYHSLKQNEYQLTGAAMAQRALRNTLLKYIGFTDGADSLVSQQYETATNMTDRMAALTEAVHNREIFGQNIIDDFYDRYKDNDLIIDKWFAAQAVSRSSTCVETVKSLADHADFNLKNPNRLRALVSSFTYRNPHAFHRKDGAGYAFLAEMVLRTDRINPQIAAKIVAPLSNWRILTEERREKMKSTLCEILRNKALSDDVKELVDKSIDD